MQICMTSWSMARRIWLELLPISWTDVSLNLIHPLHYRVFSFSISLGHYIFVAFHSLSHPEANDTVRLVPQKFLSPRVGKDCGACTCAHRIRQRCQVCRKVRTFRQLKNSVWLFFRFAYFPWLYAVCLVWFCYCRTAMVTRVRLRHPHSPRSPPKQSQGLSRCLGCSFQLPPAKTAHQRRHLKACIFKTLSTINGSSYRGLMCVITPLMAWSRVYNCSCRPRCYALMMGIESRLCRWFCYEICKHMEGRLASVIRQSSIGETLRLPGEFFAPPLPNQRRCWRRLCVSAPHLRSFHPYQHPSMSCNPHSYLRTWQSPSTTFYNKVHHGEHCKPCL